MTVPASEPAVVASAATGAFQRHRGTVRAFDDFGGWGRVGDEAGVERFFHCTTIADGTRTIEVGAEVTFLVRPAAVGHWEAADLEQVEALR